MRLHELDTILAQFQQKTHFAAQNLLELTELFTYKQLHGEGGLPQAPLSGTTRVKVDAALAAIDRLWEELAWVNAAIERAAIFRKSIWLANDANTREFEQLLCGTVIRLPALETPLSRRSLLGPAETAQDITIGALQTSMISDFEEAKSVILAVQAAWDGMASALAASSAEARALQECAARLGAAGMEPLTQLRQRIDALSAQIATDPLQVDSIHVNEIQPALQRTRTALDEIARERERIETELAGAAAMLHELDALREKTKSACAECTENIAGHQGVQSAVSEGKFNDLRDWLQTLRQKANSDAKSVRIALFKWMQTSNVLLTSERKTLEANQAPLLARAALRGRFAAFKAKAQAYAARGVAPPLEVDKLCAAAEQALYQRPTQLDVSEKAVRAFELALAEALNRMGKA